MWKGIFQDNPLNYLSYWKEIEILTYWKEVLCPSEAVICRESEHQIASLSKPTK